MITGKLKGSNKVVNVVDVYAPQRVIAKQSLWAEIAGIMEHNIGLWVVAGDFNAVRVPSERKNSSFKIACSNNFNAFISQNGLLEYEMKGGQYTCVRENGKKLSKIDRFLVCSEFFNLWPEATLRALPVVYSDHSPLILLSKARNFGAKPFRVFNSWMDKPGYVEAVEKAVEQFGFNGPPDLRLINKFNVIQRRVKEWRDLMMTKEGEEVNRALGEIEVLEGIMEDRELAEDEEWSLVENKKAILEVERRRALDLKQRSRTMWALDGDENSRFFHMYINFRKAKNQIQGLFIDGDWVTKLSLIKKEIMSFFRKRFREDIPLRPSMLGDGFSQLKEEDKSWLVEPFALAEIKEALKECGDEKAPGPDGLNMKFIKKFWHLFEKDFKEVMDYFFVDGALNVGCGSSFITLIPKLKDPVGLNNYRPISLIGVISKLVSKVLANRLKRVIGSVVSESQSAFLKGNFILDGPLLVNELYNCCKKRKKKVFFLKIDFEKAYDNVNWNFLVSILGKMGFPEKWCSWIRGIIQLARASVLVNGSPTFEFQFSKGIRQVMFDKAKSNGVVSGICTPGNGPSVSHLFYADDAIILGEWSKENIENVVRVLRIFHLCSGLKINLAKSSLFGIEVDSSELSSMAGYIGCQADKFPFKYLGLWVGANMNRVANWRPVYDVFDSRLSVWKAKTLSVGAKIRKFLWCGGESRGKIHWVAWNHVAISKERGGLGLSKLKHINVALLSKWGWRFKVDKDKLWVKVVEAIHCTRTNWEMFPVNKSLGGIWNIISSVLVKTRINDVPLRNFFKRSIGNGEDIAFWLDPWCANEPLKEKFPLLFSLEVNKRCKVCERLAGGPLGSSFVWDWRRPMWLELEVNELVDLCSLLLGKELIGDRDKWEWIGAADKDFKVGGMKRLLKGGNGQSFDYVPEWFKWLPIKCNVFVWRLGINKLATMDALQKRNIPGIDMRCVMCGDEDESAEHLFTSCCVATVIWQQVCRWCNIPNMVVFSIKDLLEAHDFCGLNSGKKEVVKGVIRVACWSIWRARNEMIFSSKPISIGGIISEIKSVGFLWLHSRSKSLKVSWDNWCKFVIM
ncbi:putative RNA-directed DNA polymerase [Helianthus annuus]|uniref:RNA-directed DNA polymerase n=1 Tax=Helianthus annuus TaxID=4232 RepID=A0A9K3J302_HELAN|nr:putative RNA-directed DNA polymerase [Helianthus annuus]